MSVYQVEEYYIYMDDLTISEDQEKELEKLFDDELLIEETEINREEGTITIDKFQDEGAAMDLEEKINEVLGND
ncbi:hypothetical protein AB832_08315 [Flavobacteriaceae bacterium (ex Bugula neritina AB1)]|jgi:hypothetical protein|nr:hypothetical protein AB832_08315 [Flavobacteriaceae bacterium (ex Bugula neritina AB1)]